jgi:hypothetical protein
VKRSLALVAVVLAAGAAPAQPVPPEPIKLALPPAAAPVPALKYVLLPELSEQTPGNAAFLYYRAFSPEWWGTLHQRDILGKVEKAARTPVADLKNSDVRWLLEWKSLREMDRAARRAYCDWELTPRLREEGIYLVFPDLQPMRQFATLLAARARLEMSEGQLDKAFYTLQTGFALARHAGDGPSLIQALVGNAIAQVMVAQLEDLLRQPGAPNLYWALTDLPQPFIDLRKPIQGEKLWLYGTFPELRDVANPHLAPARLQRLQDIAAQFVVDRFESRELKSDAAGRLALLAVVAKAYPASRQALIAAGQPPRDVDALPALQVVLIESLHEYERQRDELFKWTALPYHVARPGLARAAESKAQAEGIPIGQVMLPAALKPFALTTRLDRRISALRCIEAVRLYAADHDGRLPASLGDIKDTPIPADPITGQPFEYNVSGDRATLTGPALPGETAGPTTVLIYELTMQK